MKWIFCWPPVHISGDENQMWVAPHHVPRTTAWLDPVIYFGTWGSNMLQGSLDPNPLSALHLRLANCSPLRVPLGAATLICLWIVHGCNGKVEICNRNHMAQSQKYLLSGSLQKCLWSLIYTSGSLVWGHLSSAHISMCAICYSKHFKGERRYYYLCWGIIYIK